MSGVKLLDLFSGIGGFHLGFERAGFEFDYVGFAEVDKYASAVYKYNNPFAEELGDVKSIRSAGNKDGSRYYYEDNVTQTIASNPTSDNLPMVNQTSIRRLTPVECMRLQGFPDNHNEFGLLDGKKVAISDTQRYKQAGNAVTVDVVAAVARKIKELL